MIYPTVAGHGLLTAKAAAAMAAVPENQDLAEALLGLTEPALTGTLDVSRIQLALVEQINFQVHQGVDPLIQSYASSSHSNQQAAYRDRVVSPKAVSILAGVEALNVVAADRYDTFTSHRTRDE